MGLIVGQYFLFGVMIEFDQLGQMPSQIWRDYSRHAVDRGIVTLNFLTVVYLQYIKAGKKIVR